MSGLRPSGLGARTVRVAYRPDIDGLRAVAVLQVIAFHAFPGRVSGGFIGVDVFFVISGYLITGTILREMRGGTFTFLHFYARRMRRIVPALAVVLSGVALLGVFALLPAELTGLARHIWAGSAFVNNIVLWREAGYFDAAAETKPLLHLWSLGIEEQFYLLWPPLLLWIASRPRNVALRLIAMIVAASFTVNVALIWHHQAAAFYLIPSRFWELLVGGLLAQIELERASGDAAAQSEIAAWTAFAVLIGTTFVLSDGSAFPGWRAAVPVAASVAIISAGPRAWVNRTLLSQPIAVGIGLISYPLYLWHWPLLSIARIVEQEVPARWVRLSAIGLSFALAWMTWRFVERAAQRRWFAFERSRPRMRFCVACSIGALSLLAAAGATAEANNGFPAWWARRFPAYVAQMRDLTENPFPALLDALPRCFDESVDATSLSWCNAAHPGPADLALVGDSHALYLFPGFADTFSSRGRNALVIGESACAPILGVRAYLKGRQDKCLDANALAVSLVERARSVRTVVLSSLGPYYFSGVSFAADHIGQADASNMVLASVDPAVGSTAKPKIFEQGYASTIATLEAAGKEVVFFIDVPELNFQPSECVATRPVRITRRGVKTPCGIPRDVALARQGEYRHIVANLVRTHPNLRVFDPLPWLCDSAMCWAARDGRLFYRDSNHLSVYGSEYLSKKLQQWLDARPADADRTGRPE